MPTSPPPKSNNAAPDVRNPDKIDARITRTTRALGGALIALIQERDFSEITVQHILDRAGVGRATFYAHYRNKEDALHSSYEHFFDALDSMLARPSSIGPRLFPVTEFLEHIAAERGLVDALSRAGRLEDVSAMFSGYATRMIERRIANWSGAILPLPSMLAARMLAGALLETIRWWQDRQSVATPAQMDAAFHALARGALSNRR